MYKKILFGLSCLFLSVYSGSAAANMDAPKDEKSTSHSIKAKSETHQKNAAQKEGDKEKAISAEAVTESDKYDQVVSKYKAYLASVDQKIRDEIIEYRKSLREINNQKRDLYKRLSQAAQAHLKKESEFRSSLPVETRKKFLKQIYKNANVDTSSTNEKDNKSKIDTK